MDCTRWTCVAVKASRNACDVARSADTVRAFQHDRLCERAWATPCVRLGQDIHRKIKGVGDASRQRLYTNQRCTKYFDKSRHRLSVNHRTLKDWFLINLPCIVCKPMFHRKYVADTHGRLSKYVPHQYVPFFSLHALVYQNGFCQIGSSGHNGIQDDPFKKVHEGWIESTRSWVFESTIPTLHVLFPFGSFATL